MRWKKGERRVELRIPNSFLWSRRTHLSLGPEFTYGSFRNRIDPSLSASEFKGILGMQNMLRILSIIII